MKLDIKGLREQIESESGLKFDEAGDKQDSEKVLDMIGAKFSTFQALRGANRAEIKSVASKYMGLPIRTSNRNSAKLRTCWKMQRSGWRILWTASIERR